MPISHQVILVGAGKRCRPEQSGRAGPSDRSDEKIPGAVRETIRNRAQQPDSIESVDGPEAGGPPTRIARSRNSGLPSMG